jgi:hypothetical protein
MRSRTHAATLAFAGTVTETLPGTADLTWLNRLEPQLTIWLLTGQHAFPPMVSAIEGNKAETKTMLL